MFKWFKKDKPIQEPQQTSEPIAPVKPISIEDIKDEDMMVAVLVATIDYTHDKNADVRLVSVKQIG